jgi:UDP-N-acetylmuramate dehydrogenase
LKGTRIGGACISPKHGNFIINLGGATAGDVLALIDLMRHRVREEMHVELELEVQVVGED